MSIKLGILASSNYTTPVLPIVTAGLITYYDASNILSYSGSGSIWFDISGNSNNANIFNSPTFTTANGGCFIMNGTNNYITPSTSVFNLNTTQTIWYKWNGINQASLLSFLGVTSTNGYGMWMNDGTNSANVGNKISGLIAANSFNGGGVTSSLSSVNWSQITMIRNISAGLMQFYINGVLDGTGNPFTGITNTTANFLLGQSANPFAAGNLGAVMYYDRALSASEVLQNYNATKTRFGL